MVLEGFLDRRSRDQLRIPLASGSVLTGIYSILSLRANLRQGQYSHPWPDWQWSEGIFSPIPLLDPLMTLGLSADDWIWM